MDRYLVNLRAFGSVSQFPHSTLTVIALNLLVRLIAHCLLGFCGLLLVLLQVLDQCALPDLMPAGAWTSILALAFSTVFKPCCLSSARCPHCPLCREPEHCCLLWCWVRELRLIRIRARLRRALQASVFSEQQLSRLHTLSSRRERQRTTKKGSIWMAGIPQSRISTTSCTSK